MMLERNVILMERELGIYVHIPFCIKKCAYCDFISYPNKLEMQKTYVDKMLEEMDNSKKIIGKCNITSIYILAHCHFIVYPNIPLFFTGGCSFIVLAS